MRARRWPLLLLAGGLLLTAACSSDGTTAADPSSAGTAAPQGTTGTSAVGAGSDGTAAPATPGTGTGARPAPSVPVVDPGSVEAFCALEQQLEDLSAEQMADVDPSAPDGFREAMARFLDDNDSVIEQYVAAAPPEIRADVERSMRQLRDAVDDPSLFAELVVGDGDTTASERVSAFAEANCPA